MDAIKQVISEEKAGLGLASVSLKRKAENAKLLNFIVSRNKTPEKESEKWAEMTHLI